VSLPATLISRPVTLDQLVALSDEIAALARAGVPLDRGLKELAADMPGRLGQLARDIGQRLESGESLSHILAESQHPFPPAYRAVVEAGLRAGRLPAALEDVARTARRISHLRTSLGTALLYPLIVLLLAWLLFLFTCAKVLPVLVRLLAEFEPAAEQWYGAAMRFAHWAPWLAWGVPLVLVLLAAWTWFRSGQVASGVELHPWLAWGAIGSLRRMQRAGRMAALSETLSTLIANDVPLDDAVALASAAVGSPQLAKSGRELADRIRRGQIGGKPPPGFPPLLAWTITCGNREQLQHSLRRTAQVYRDEFDRRGQWLTLYVPLIATAIVGGAVVMIYGLLSLGPWIVIMRRLAQPYMS
jgi:general secretion pathway protein F